MDAKLEFRKAFLKKCADNGLTIKQAKALLVKISTDKTTLLKFAASLKQANPLDTVVNTAGSLVNTAVGGIGTAAKAVGVPALVAAGVVPPALGYVGGKLMSKATDYDDTDVEEIKLRELIDEYRRSTQMLHNMDNKKQTAVRRTAIR